MPGDDVGHRGVVFIVEFNELPPRSACQQLIISELSQNHYVRLHVAAVGRSYYRNKALSEAAHIMGETGDKWREFAVSGARMCKTDERSQSAYDELSEKIKECADSEERIYRFLKDSI